MHTKPTTHQGDLAKLPRALAPLLARPQWAVWRWTATEGGHWQKPPFQARDPRRHASTKDPATWSGYPTALDVVQAGEADGISYIITEQDDLAAADLDHCRDAYGSIDVWAQLTLARALDTYCEITPSGTGLRIWGTANGAALHRKFTLPASEAVPRVTTGAALELFRHTNKALTITGLDLRQGRSLDNIDQLLHWAAIFAERQKPAPAAPGSGAGISSNSLQLSVDQIEYIITTGILPLGANRSDLFHAFIGHFLGCGWTEEQIIARFERDPGGLANRYIAQGRLAQEVRRSGGKFKPDLFTQQPEQKPPDEGLDEQDEAPDKQPDPEEDELDDDDVLDEPLAAKQQPGIHSWNDPDPSLLDDRRGELPEFPLESLSVPLQAWVRRAAAGAGVTPAHVAVPLLAISSALIGTARRVRASSSWSQPTTTWMALVGYSGSGKTPGLDASKAALRVVERSRGYQIDNLRRKHEAKVEIAKAAAGVWKAQVKEAVQAGTPPPPKPIEADDPGPFVPPRLFVSSVTIEKLGVLLTVRPQGLLYLADELSSLFLNMARYSRGQDNEFWLEAWNGGGYVVERMSRMPLDIRHLLVGMIGGFQPDKLAQSFEGAADGMYARLCFAWPSESDYQPLTAAAEVDPEIVQAFERLAELGGDEPETFEPIHIPLSAEALAAFEGFRKFVFAGKARLFDRERDWWSKMQAHVLRLAGTLAFLTWSMGGGPEPDMIAAPFMRSAIILVRDYFYPHSRAALRLVGMSERDADARRVLHWVQAERCIEVSRENVRRIALARKLNADETQILLNRLARAGWLRETIRQTGGRPSTRWEVNPQLLMAAHE